MILDRLIAPFAPAWALQRTIARQQLDLLTRKYDGASQSRRTRGWNAARTSAQAETRWSINTLRNRARDLVRNNVYAASGVDKIATYQVGTGIIPRSNTGDTKLDKLADAAWTEWAENAGSDRVGKMSIYGQQHLAARSRAESGEVLLRFMPLSVKEMRSRGLRVPLAVHLLEADYIDWFRENREPDGSVTHQGVKFAPDGRVEAYWLFDHHPGDIDAVAMHGYSSTLQPATDYVHLFRTDRPGQIRGVPDLTPAMLRLRMLDDLEDAALEQARIQACLVAFVTSQSQPGKGPLEGTQPGIDGNRKTMSPGMIERLYGAEDVKFNTPPSNSQGFQELARHELHAIAEAMDLTYDVLTGDTSRSNFSSLRAGRLSLKRRIERAQWLMHIPIMCQPTWDRFVSAAQLSGVLPMRDGRWPVKWSPPRFEMLDPGAELKALKEGIRDGLITWPQAVGELGNEPRAQAEEIALWNKVFDDLGIVLDIDPRRITSAAGMAQDPAQNAKVEAGLGGGPDAPDDTTPAIDQPAAVE